MIGEGHVLCSFVKLILGFSNSYEKLEVTKMNKLITWHDSLFHTRDVLTGLTLRIVVLQLLLLHLY